MEREIFWPWMVSCWCTLIHIVHVIFQGQVWLPKGCTGWWFQSREQLLFKHWKHHSWSHYHLDGNRITIKHVPSNPDVAPHLKRIIIIIIIIIIFLVLDREWGEWSKGSNPYPQLIFIKESTFTTPSDLYVDVNKNMNLSCWGIKIHHTLWLLLWQGS